MSDAPNPRMKVVDSGEESGIRWTTCEAPLYGAVNGYVRIPKGHPWHGLGYDDIDVRVHGGLTYSEGDWIGFDCLHLGDYWPGQNEYDLLSYDAEWTAEMVAAETRELARKVAAANV
jgi:hypothetical protein